LRGKKNIVTRRNLLGAGAAAIAATGLEADVLDPRPIPRPPQRGAVPESSRIKAGGLLPHHALRSIRLDAGGGFPIEFEPHDASGWRNGI
jgi:hypothetical protein